MSVDRETVRRIARLARLAMDEDQFAAMEADADGGMAAVDADVDFLYFDG